jgi:hypothetical protein
MIAAWARVAYYGTLWSAADLASARTDRLVLNPGKR